VPIFFPGIGVDDMFVIVGAWKNLTEEEHKQPIPEKIAITLKRAGVSITVTSVTDIVAFGIGGSTVSLHFCYIQDILTLKLGHFIGGKRKFIPQCDIQ
jgi:hypothetical protein